MHRWLFPLVILALGAGGFAWLKASKPETPAIVVEEKSWIVETESISIGAHSPTLSLYGSVESPRLSRLSAAVNADVIDVQILEGQWVSRNSLLVSLDDTDTRLELAQRSAEVDEITAQKAALKSRHDYDRAALVLDQRLLALSRRGVQRALELAQTKVGSQSQLDEARQNEARQMLALDERSWQIDDFENQLAELQARLDRAIAQRDLARTNLSRTAVRAPFSGRIAEVLVAPGDRVRIGDILVRLYDTSALEIRSQIPTAHLPTIRAALREGQQLAGTMLVDGVRLSAALSRLSGEVIAGSGGLDAFFSIESDGEWLQLGRSVEFVLTLPVREGVVALPVQAIYGNDRLFRLVEGRLSAVAVERVGESHNGDQQSRILVKSAQLSDGDKVLITQLPNAIDGLKVRELN